MNISSNGMVVSIWLTISMTIFSASSASIGVITSSTKRMSFFKNEFAVFAEKYLNKDVKKWQMLYDQNFGKLFLPCLAVTPILDFEFWFLLRDKFI